MIPETELAWAAGFFDGEGSIGTYPQHARTTGWHTRMSVTQKDPRPLHRFLAAVQRGRVYPRGKNGMHVWQLVSLEGILQVVEALWPYLSEPKREQVHEALLARRDDRRSLRRSARKESA